MKKRILSILLTLALLVSLFPAALAEDIVIVDPEAAVDPVGADALGGPEEIEEPTTEELTRHMMESEDITNAQELGHGICGANLEWVFYDNGELLITGTGPMADYATTKPSWDSYSGSIEKVTIMDGATSIGNGAFYYYGKLREISIPKTVIEIGIDAFQNCSSLSNINLPSGLLSIGSGAFLACPLTSITIPDSVQTIGDRAFLRCNALESVKIGNGVKNIGNGAFRSDWNITQVTMGKNVESIGEYAFQECTRLTNITLPESLKSIGACAFQYCRALEIADLPGGLTFLGARAFDECSSLTRAAIPGGVYCVDEKTFHGCVNLSSLTIAEGVGIIGYRTFYDNDGVTELIIPDSVTTMYDGSFLGCSNLETVVIGSGVTFMDNYSFSGCSKLTSIKFRGSAPNIRTCFENVTARAYYPANDPSWTEDVRQNYGGTLFWVPYTPEPVLSLDGMSTDGVALSWNAMDGAEKYALQRDDGSGWKNLKTVKTNKFTDETAQMGQTYSYRVRAYVDGAWTDYSKAITVLFNPFTDVSGTKTIEYVAWAYNNGIVKGTGTTKFSPDAPCTRVNFIMMLWKMHGSPDVGGTNPFSDVSGTKTTKAILWALKAGVINSAKKFNPDEPISRIQIVMMLWKLAGSPNVAGENPFTDVSGSKTTKAVLWAYQNGITKGTSATKFSPDKDCTRVQLVIFLYKYNNIYHVI